MAAYAVMARIGRVDPHLSVWGVDEGRDGSAPPGGAIVDDEVALEAEFTSDPGAVVERLIRMRELWRQTTFYLFDADSWRT